MPASLHRWSWCRGALALAIGLGFAALTAGAEAQPAEKPPAKAPAKAKPPTKGKGPAAPAAKPGKPAPAKKVDVEAQRTLLEGADADLAVGAAGELGASSDEAAHDVLLDTLVTGLAPEAAAATLTALSM